MKKINYLIVLLSIFTATAASATWEQNIRVCASVEPYQDNTVRSSISFYSSDFFDFGQEAHLQSGSTCIAHTYMHGPKNMTIKLRSGLGEIFYVDDSCTSLGYKVTRRFSTTHMEYSGRAQNHHEEWDFVLQGIAAPSGYIGAYNVSCTQTSFE